MARTQGASAQDDGWLSGSLKSLYVNSRRDAYLAQLQHLCGDRANQLILVIADKPSGKTWLCDALRQQLPPAARCIATPGIRLSDTRNAFEALAKGLRIPCDDDPSTDELRKRLIDEIGSSSATLRQVVLLIDDADTVELEALEALLELVSVSRLQLLLFGHSRIAGLVQQITRFLDLAHVEVSLDKFSVDQVSAPIAKRLEHARNSRWLAAVEEPPILVQENATGVPDAGQMQAAVDLLRKKNRAGRARVKQVRSLQAIAASALLTVLAITFWPTGSDTTSDQTIPIPPLELASEAIEPAASPVRAPATIPEEQAAAAPEPAVPQPAVPQPAAPEPAAQSNAPEPTTLASAADHVRDNAWLLQQPPDTYTIQLATVFSPDAVREYLADRNSLQGVGVYQIQRQATTFHALIYGIYDSYTEAQAQLQALPANIQADKPMVRSVKLIQKKLTAS